MKLQLTISLLVSDRIETLEKCLDSLKPLLRELDSELIAVFTGKDADTLELVKQYATLVIPFSWCNDFAKARNVGLEQAKGEWFLFLDDDEWFDDTEEMIRFFKSGEYQNYQSALYIQRNYADWEGTSYSDIPVGRMCRIKPETRFVMPIHEYLEPFSGPRKDFQTYVHHFGYVDWSQINKVSSKSERNLPLLLKRLEDGPVSDIPHCCMQIAQEYGSEGQYEKAIRYCKKGLEASKSDKQIYSVEMWMQAQLPVLLSLAGDDKAAIEEGERILHSSRILDVTAVNLYATLVTICHGMKEYKKGLQYVKHFHQKMEYLQVHPEITSRQVGVDITFDSAEKKTVLTYVSGLAASIETGQFAFIKELLTWIPWDDKLYVSPHYSHLEEWKNRYKRHQEVILESFSHLDTQNPYVNLQKAYYAEEQGQLSEAEQFWRTCIIDCPSWLVWQPVQMAVRNHFSLNPLMEQISVDIWEECTQTLAEQISISDMQSFYEGILPLLEDYLLCAYKVEQAFLEKQLSQGILGTSHLLTLLRRYCESVIFSAKEIYSDKVLCGGNSYVLPSQYRFAFTVERVLHLIEDGQYAECIPRLKEAFHIYPKLTPVISQLIRYLTEQIERPVNIVSDEFALLGQQVKGVLLGLMENGQWEEAYGVTAQLISLLPDDLEVLRMKQEILRQGSGMNHP